MPKIVDHEERRREVAAVAARLVAEGGIEAVTVRDVAAAAGCSTAIVSHYFTDKRALLLFTYREAAAQARVRLAAVRDRHPGDVRRTCEALLPLDRDRLAEWAVWLAYWGYAIGDEELAAEQRRRVLDTRAAVAAALRASHAARGGPARQSYDDEARTLLALVTGIASQATFDPDDWPAARQRRLLAAALPPSRLSTLHGVRAP